MASSNQTLYNSVWKVDSVHIHPSLRHLSVKAKPKDWRKKWSTRISAVAYQMESHGENVYPRPSGHVTEKEGHIIYRIRTWYEPKGLYQAISHRCLNSPLTFEEKQENMSWDEVIDEERKYDSQIEYLKRTRVSHFKRKKDDKIKNKKNRKNVWTNKKASKKRRR